jgi:hypothetical protein
MRSVKKVLTAVDGQREATFGRMHRTTLVSGNIFQSHQAMSWQAFYPNSIDPKALFGAKTHYGVAAYIWRMKVHEDGPESNTKKAVYAAAGLQW